MIYLDVLETPAAILFSQFPGRVFYMVKKYIFIMLILKKETSQQHCWDFGRPVYVMYVVLVRHACQVPTCAFYEEKIHLKAV